MRVTDFRKIQGKQKFSTDVPTKKMDFDSEGIGMNFLGVKC